MAADFDQFPFYDPIIKEGTNNISDIWMGALSTFIETLIGYLSQNGIFIPVVNQTQMNAIKHPVDGQVIYNKDINRFIGREGGAWKIFTLV